MHTTGRPMKTAHYRIAFIAAICMGATFARADTASEKNAPQDVGRRIAKNLLDRPEPTKRVGYPEVCTAYGSLRLAGELQDNEPIAKIAVRYVPVAKPDGQN